MVFLCTRDCGKSFDSQSNLDKHLNQRIPCNSNRRKYACENEGCSFKAVSRQSKFSHMKICRPKISKESLEKRNEELQEALLELQAKSNSEKTRPKQTIDTRSFQKEDFKMIESIMMERITKLEDENKTSKRQNNIPVISGDWTIKSMNIAGISDLFKPMVYISIPGPNLITLDPIPHNAILIKLGQTDDFLKRDSTHKKDYGGFELIDSIITYYPTVVERRIKAWLKIKNKLIKGKTDKKDTNDSELFFVESQQEYEEILKHAVTIAKDYKNEVAQAMQSAENTGENIDTELQHFKLKLEVLRLQNKIDDLKL